MTNLKASDALWRTAEAVVDYGKKMGIKLKITDVYNTKTIEKIALLSAFMREIIESSSDEVINLIDDTK